ncbi:hypothetical protein RN001_007054 [Aquatica leii]|uniref:Phosphatidylinositol-glycan biosynthesis class W protein n=1 Tax=Aquatica leii TaxID=1421715 RepID=A0AAN7SNQ6_9COLE|nr:hypothetical protein RN001_007054 [Aquatica leii]
MNKNYEDLMHSDGTTAYETFSVIVPSAFIIFIASIIIHSFFRTNRITQITAEFILIVLPFIFIITVLANYATDIIILSIIASITLIGLLRNKCTIIPIQKHKNYNYVTLGRCTIFFLTVISILAVDFMVFPRRFAKTRNYGYSLMDVGVGLYVFASGALSYNNQFYRISIQKSITSAVPLILLGSARFIITQEIHYQVIDSEYGVHWNFFITLATVQILSSIVFNLVNINAIYAGGILLFLHENLLQLGLGEYVLSDIERNTFFRANREGIVSSLGYLGLYFLSSAFGKMFDIKNSSGKFSWKLIFKFLSLIGFLLWSTLILEKNFGVSRRLANSGYCIWVLFIGVFMFALLYVIELLENYVCGAVYIPVLFEAINYNALMFFLVANLLTGAVNIIFDTLSMYTMPSLVILSVYMICNCAFTYILFVKKIRLK